MALGLLSVFPAGSLAAQARVGNARTIVFVMESTGGLRGAAELRAALNQAGCAVVSPAEARRQSLEPDALVTVATDRAHAVQVMYWDREGRTDSLASPSPATAEQLSAVVLALSSALIERHRQDTSGAPAMRMTMGSDARGRARLFDDVPGSQAIYAMIGYTGPLSPRTNVQLRFEDF
jgi:hypothetical protein